MSKPIYQALGKESFIKTEYQVISIYKTHTHSGLESYDIFQFAKHPLWHCVHSLDEKFSPDWSHFPCLPSDWSSSYWHCLRRPIPTGVMMFTTLWGPWHLLIRGIFWLKWLDILEHIQRTQYQNNYHSFFRKGNWHTHLEKIHDEYGNPTFLFFSGQSEFYQRAIVPIIYPWKRLLSHKLRNLALTHKLGVITFFIWFIFHKSIEIYPLLDLQQLGATAWWE